MSGKYKLYWVFAIVVFVVVMIFTTTMLWVGMHGPFSANNNKLSNHYPNSIFYEIFVRSFNDSNGDGIGDINGVTEKLDYLKDLGIEAIWLMPINPSPSYHGYDITDYYNINAQYGTLEDFKNLLKEAHKRNIKVIMDLVINHTSKDIPWFKDALASKDSPYRDWYIWADDKTNTNEVGDWGQQLWHGYGKNKYYGVFWEGMPDLNYDNLKVREKMIDIGDFWQKLGVDGFRLDAAKYIYSHNKNKNYEWWKEFKNAMAIVNKNVFIVGEVWDSPSVIGPYLKESLTSGFDFDLSSKIVASAKQEDDAGAVTYLTRVRDYYAKMNPNYIDSTFLTNHDMDRVMSVLGGNVNHAKMAASLLLTLPGSPFIYYGEEIGMLGAKPDEYIREPMLWTNDPKGKGQTHWEVPRYNNGKNAPSVEAEENDPNSLYHVYKSFIHLRRSYDVLSLGDIKETSIMIPGIVSYERTYNNKSVLVIHNMSKTEKTFDIKFNLIKYTKVLFEDGLQNIKKYTDHNEVTIKPYSTIILEP